MKNIDSFIQERLVINSKSNSLAFTDEEMRDDYDTIRYAYTKAEKQKIASKYGINSNKIREIELAILDELRENRQHKKEYTNSDINDFLRYDVPDRYDSFAKYLDKEPKEFVEKILEYFEDRAKKINIHRMSINDKYVLRRVENLKKYLNTK